MESNKFVDAIIRLSFKRNQELKEVKKRQVKMKDTLNRGIKKRVKRQRNKAKFSGIYENLAEAIIR